MGSFIGERCVLVPLAINSSTTTEVRSQAVPLRGVEKVTILCGHELALNVLDSVAHAESSLVGAATFAVYVGDATQGAASFSALTSATCVLGMTTVGQVRNAQQIQIQVVGSWATGSELIISYGPTTKTYTMQTNATLADNQLSASDSTAFAGALANAIAAHFPALELVEGTTVGSGDTKAWTGILKEKYPGMATLSAQVTAQSVSSSCIGNVNVHKMAGVIEFTPAQVLATNSCYTQFAVGIDCSVTVTKQHAVAILQVAQRGNTNPIRTRL